MNKEKKVNNKFLEIYYLKKQSKGITLIALVVSIIVLLILAGVSISMLSGNNSILKNAHLAKENTKAGEIQERINLAITEDTQDQVLGGTPNKLNTVFDDLKNEGKITEEEYNTLKNGGSITMGDAKINGFIPTDEEDVKTKIGDKGYVGYYADIDNDGTPDGVIYADLAVSVSGQWGDAWGDYGYLKQDNLKKYLIIQENYDGPFGNKPVIQGVKSTANDRFYVMALQDITYDGSLTETRNTYMNWYYSASGKLDSSMNTPATGEGSNDFGQGKNKTKIMVEKWNEEAYGSKNGGSTYKDLWGIFKHTNNDQGIIDPNTWFIPSKGEWSAYGENLQIAKDSSDTRYYVNLGLSDWYWSSSQYDTYRAYSTSFAMAV